MADHLQNQILDAVKAALVSAALVATGRVYLDRTDEIPEGGLPAIDILGGDEGDEESIEYQTVHFPPLQARAFTFPIASITRGEDCARSARNLAGDVEAVLLASSGAITVGGRKVSMLLASSSSTKTGDANTRMCAVRQSWQAQYHTQGGAPTAPR